MEREKLAEGVGGARSVVEKPTCLGMGEVAQEAILTLGMKKESSSERDTLVQSIRIVPAVRELHTPGVPAR
jgi:hypothetical protein